MVVVGSSFALVVVAAVAAVFVDVDVRDGPKMTQDGPKMAQDRNFAENLAPRWPN